MKNQIKVDKNRKGILFFLDFGPLICGGGLWAILLLMLELKPSVLKRWLAIYLIKLYYFIMAPGNNQGVHI